MDVIYSELFVKIVLSFLLFVPSGHGIIYGSASSMEAPDSGSSSAISLPKMFLLPESQIMDKPSWPVSELKVFLHLLTMLELIFGDDNASKTLFANS